MCLISGEPKYLKNSKNASISRGGQNFRKSLKTHLENVVKNKCTEFEQNRSTGNVFNFGGTKRSGEGGEGEACSRSKNGIFRTVISPEPNRISSSRLRHRDRQHEIYPYTGFRDAALEGRGLYWCAKNGHSVTCIYSNTLQERLSREEGRRPLPRSLDIACLQY